MEGNELFIDSIRIDRFSRVYPLESRSATEMEEDTLVELCCLFQNGCKRKNALLQDITHDFNFSPGWYLCPSTFAWPVDFYIPVNGEF